MRLEGWRPVCVIGRLTYCRRRYHSCNQTAYSGAQQGATPNSVEQYRRTQGVAGALRGFTPSSTSRSEQRESNHAPVGIQAHQDATVNSVGRHCRATGVAVARNYCPSSPLCLDDEGGSEGASFGVHTPFTIACNGLQYDHCALCTTVATGCGGTSFIGL